MHNRLRLLRENRGLTAKELAKRLDYSHSSIHAAEKGKLITTKLLSAYNRYFRRDIPDEISLTCVHCGKEFVSQRGLQLHCSDCARKKKPMGRGVTIEPVSKYNPNPITRDTVMIICMFHLEGQTPKQIAKHLMRPVDVVEKLLARAQKNGTYQKYRNMKLLQNDISSCGNFSFTRVKSSKTFTLKEDLI